ncbi:DUF4476 domain-containing protein [Chitinophaga sp. G-6-1-13]|uniref:DUF4476 domain-containing protein n=1 Tax=Chitinophaga fulva TaxID=2728842 RepID=A0A848GI90_9BACT|nr:DUF4476 domain-containing protein [Chitinophaga fulva]NML35568.1 DUF4476 domain-containing protein [Chitinophaga fulva]
MLLKYRTVLYLLACLFYCGQAWAQNQQHYVYIQSEKGQPFYVKVNGQVLSSTERGYIILPKLESGTVPMSIGYAQSEGPAQEQKFYVRIAKNDQGFLLKKGALYNLQTFREIKSDNGDGSAATAAAQEPAPEAVAASNPEDTTRKEMMGNLQKELEDTFSQKATVTGPGKPSAPKSGNAFSSALDKVVVSGDDREEPVAEVAPAKPAKGTEVPVEETAVKKPRGKKHKAEREPLSEEEQDILKSVMAEESKTAASEAATADQPKQEAEEQPAPKKQKKHKKREGDPDFIEFQEEGKASVPAPAAAVVAVPAETTAPAVDLPATEEAPVRKKKKRKLFDDTEHPNNIITDSSGYGVAVSGETPSRKKKKNDEAVAEASEKKDAGTRLINTDCGNVMDEATFRKVLRKFVSAKSDESMIDMFRKSTRNYCLETEQIKSLALLVSSDEARYRLLDMAYAKTYDTEKYGSLESLLTESYYKGRFRAMLHK